jgi:hypothetical protein
VLLQFLCLLQRASGLGVATSNMESELPNKVPLVGLFGPGGVGKDAMAIRFVCNDFKWEYDPTVRSLLNIARSNLQ